MNIAGVTVLRNIVTLNSIQGPCRLTDLRAVGTRLAADFSLRAQFERSARWMLKQVQHDELGRVGASSND